MNKLEKELTELRIQQLKRFQRRSDEEYNLWKQRHLIEIRRTDQLIKQNDWDEIMERIMKDPTYLEYIAKREEEKKSKEE